MVNSNNKGWLDDATEALTDQKAEIERLKEELSHYVVCLEEYQEENKALNNQGDRVKEYLERMDNNLIHRDGSAELSHDEAKKALRDCYLISCGEEPKQLW